MMDAEEIRGRFDGLDAAEVANIVLGALEIALRAVDDTTSAVQSVARDLGRDEPEAERLIVTAQAISFAARRRLMELEGAV